MNIKDYTLKLLRLSETISRWYDSFKGIDERERAKIATYCDNIADTIARAITACEVLNAGTNASKATRDARREFGRIAGYVEDITAALVFFLDGRKIAGVKRRLESLVEPQLLDDLLHRVDSRRLARMSEAEGYFRALGDRLRT